MEYWNIQKYNTFIGDAEIDQSVSKGSTYVNRMGRVETSDYCVLCFCSSRAS